MILYKYLSPSRIDVLQRQRIRFTQPPCFNDPFECKPYIKGMGLTIEESKRIGEKELKSQGVPQHEIEKMLEEMYSDGNMVRMYPKVKDFMLDLLSRTTAILSLSERNDSILMWSHYTQNHEGFVIGFNTESSFFAIPNNEKVKYTTGKLNKVIYSFQRPTNFLTKMELHELFFTKSTDWEYEKEWRFFTNVDKADEVIDNGEYPICLYSFPADAVHSIILGIRASNELVRKTRLLLLEERYRHVELYKAEIDEMNFCINIARI